MKKYIILTAVFLLTSYITAAQEVIKQAQSEVKVIEIDTPRPAPIAETVTSLPWTLAQCIAWAREHNIEIARQELLIQDAELAARQTRLNYIPSISASVGSSSNFGTSYDAVSQYTRDDYTSMSGSISAGTEVFAGMKKLHNLKRSDLSLKETLLSIEKAKNDLELNVTAAYLDILFAEEKVRISEVQIGILQMQVERSRKQMEAGAGTLGDLLQIQSQLADAKHQKLLADNQRVISYFNICQLLEIEDFMHFRIAAPEAVVVFADISISSVEEIMEKAQDLPQIEGAQIGIDIAQRDISIARADYYPSLRFSASYGSGFEFNATRQIKDPDNPGGYITVPYNTGDQLKNRAMTTIGLNLSIPIFNSLTVRNNVRSKRIALQRADYNLRVAQKQLSKEIQQAFIDAHASLEQYNSALSNTETYEESFRMVEQKFNLGAATPVDYGVALYNLSNARANLSQSKFQFIFKAKILDFYKGIPIELK